MLIPSGESPYCHLIRPHITGETGRLLLRRSQKSTYSQCEDSRVFCGARRPLQEAARSFQNSSHGNAAAFSGGNRPGLCHPSSTGWKLRKRPARRDAARVRAMFTPRVCRRLCGFSSGEFASPHTFSSGKCVWLWKMCLDRRMTV